jgi:hypothetical protein
VNGTDIFLSPMAMGGIFRIDSPNTISGAGSVADQDLAGTLSSGATLSGTLTSPDSFGSLKLNLTTLFAPTPIQFTGYIVDGNKSNSLKATMTAPGPGSARPRELPLAKETTPVLSPRINHFRGTTYSRF